MFKTLIVGAGAMGSLFGGLLHRNGVDVTLFNRANLHTEKIELEGLTLIDKSEEEKKYRVPIVTKVEDLEADYDLVIILLKTFTTEKVLGQIQGKIHPDTVILSLQNGIGNKERIESVFPKHLVLIGGSSYGATKLDEGVIAQRAFGTTFIGAADESEKTKQVSKQVSDLLNKGEIITEVSENVDSVIWSKLMVNIALNGLTAMVRLRNGDAVASLEGKSIVKNLLEEATAVAEKKRIPLLYENSSEEIIKIAEDKVGKNTSSMLTDILKKRTTEIDAINGAIVEYGKELGIDPPYNDLLTKLIKITENSYTDVVEK